MKFLILRPSDGKTLDPRGLKLASSDALHKAAPVIGEADTEDEAARAVRRLEPDAVPMIFQVPVGSGHMVLLGLLNDQFARQRVNVEAEIPFVMFVQAVPEYDADRQRLKKGHGFTEDTWRLRPVCPDLYESHEVELRATDLRVPAFTQARVGYHNGRLTVFVEVGGIELSMTFTDDLQLVERPQIAGDGNISHVGPALERLGRGDAQ